MVVVNNMSHLLRNTPELSRNFYRHIVNRTPYSISGLHHFYGSQQRSRYVWGIQPAPHLVRNSQYGYATAITGNVSEPGILKKFVKKMGWLDHSKGKLKRSGFDLYENIGEKVSTPEFFEVCELPDTFFSWFLVTELHVWLLMVRLMAEGDEGRYTRNCLVEAMWEDVNMRAKKLGDSSPTARQDQIEDIVSSFQAALFSYDEGLLSDDKTLASALWRRLFSKSCNDPERLECCVQYVRRQAAYLDSLSQRQLMLDCKVEWPQLLEQDSQRRM